MNSNLATQPSALNTMPASCTATNYAPNTVPVVGQPAMGQQFLVQNHPDTVNNRGKGHNINAGKVEVASLDPMAMSTMNSNPAAPNLSNVVTKHHVIPNAPNMGNNDNNNRTGNNNKETIRGQTNIVAPQAVATHLGGDPNLNTNTHIQNNSSAAYGATNAAASHTLGRNANIGNEINTNPVATNHPQANVSGGDIHTNQILNPGVLNQRKADTTDNTLSNKHATTSDTTLDKERPLYR